MSPGRGVIDPLVLDPFTYDRGVEGRVSPSGRSAGWGRDREAERKASGSKSSNERWVRGCEDSEWGSSSSSLNGSCGWDRMYGVVDTTKRVEGVHEP